MLAVVVVVVAAVGATFAGDPDIGPALLGPVGPSTPEVAAEVRKRGFWAGRAIGDEACNGCHTDAAAQWRTSAHRFSSFNNPYYRLATEAFRRDRGAESARFCGNCHEPVLVATNQLVDLDPATPAAQAGITCVSCHAIEATDLEGNGRYRNTAGPFRIEQPFHSARLRPALMTGSRFCATCHKVGLTPEVTTDGWRRGQNDYDAWQASAVGGTGAPSVFRPAETRVCQDCHMPLEPASMTELGAKNGMLRSHRFLAANSALPHLRGDADAEARVRAFLRDRASVDLVWIDGRHVDVVMRARNVGHRFPGGTNDSNEVWLEVKAFSAKGRLLGSSGVPDAAGRLPADTHLIRAQPVDRTGDPLRRRDVQHLRGVVFDTSLAPSDPQAVRYELPASAARVEARFLYRKFSPDYADAACTLVPDAVVRARCRAIPIVEVARTTGAPGGKLDFRRLLDHGLALADAPADRAEQARQALQAARDLQPDRPEPWLGLARLSLRLGQTDEVVTFATEAERRAPDHPAAPFLRSLALLRGYRFAEARPAAEQLARLLPGDRQGLLLLARLRGLTGDPTGALAAADATLVIDPESEDAHLQRSLSLGQLARTAEAAQAEAQFLRYRVETETDLTLRRQFRARHPAVADESEPVHTHTLR